MLVVSSTASSKLASSLSGEFFLSCVLETDLFVLLLYCSSSNVFVSTTDNNALNSSSVINLSSITFSSVLLVSVISKLTRSELLSSKPTVELSFTSLSIVFSLIFSSYALICFISSLSVVFF